MGDAEDRLKVICENIEGSDISACDLKSLDVVKILKSSNCKFWKTLSFVGVLVALVLVVLTLLNKDDRCLIDMPQDASKLFRDPQSCDFCRNVKVEKVGNISSEDFLRKYALPLRPLLVHDGTSNWPAFTAFNFDFFKALFENDDINRGDKKNCQFFPYKTGFKSLQEAFSMDEHKALLSSGEKSWYIGWSNCNDDVGRYLRSYYNRPYFLSNTSENLALSWVFMGGAGHGAHMHVDNVHYPSWQAQISGKKLWKLAPPPECYYQCNSIDVVVEAGDIIVLDTNRWYHQTIVQPGEISISIGSEFD